MKQNPILEAAYQKKPKGMGHKEIEALAKKTELGVRQVERFVILPYILILSSLTDLIDNVTFRWLRKRLNRDKPTVLEKFSESG